MALPASNGRLSLELLHAIELVHVAQQYSILQNNNAKDSTNGKTRRYKLSGGVRAALSKKNECLSGENPASDRMASLGKAVR
ncbi:hypothetical protein F441_21031 [Phytophthora nicotianae CJ01A1]|uniref:Uncharacterized protein n=2 Tax=Phytophthora nicotianae TaxID=4792 RepID=W2VWP0_PHYNI|nr:hypothetical protein F441_21031 [Phytophthora nicotianae CJ01A1]